MRRKGLQLSEMGPLSLRSAEWNASELRRAQEAWSRTSVRLRLKVVRRIRDAVAVQAKELINLFPSSLFRSRSDCITCEILPLAEACRFLELEAERILAPRQLSTTSRPFWLRRVAVEVRREPLGVILIIGPANYPLFLAGVQVLQALVAGNAVLLKPGRGGGRLLEKLAELAFSAGVPRRLITVLNEQADSAIQAIDEGVDKIVITGSVHSGRAVLRRAAERITPTIVELSGDASAIVQASADLMKAARAIAWGLRLNGGETCIAPRRVLVHSEVAEEFKTLLRAFMGETASGQAPIQVIAVSGDDEALALANANEYGLAAAIFGNEWSARRVAVKIRAGVVVINDMIFPTADPRVPFGGRGLSGFGITRGQEGLLEMTTAKAVITQRAKKLRHLEPLPGKAEELFTAYLEAAHRCGWAKRVKAWWHMASAVRESAEKS
jgi:acyl-CoA reductase-like NAD-dependent aldehyde dehydrogenase